MAKKKRKQQKPGTDEPHRLAPADEAGLIVEPSQIPEADRPGVAASLEAIPAGQVATVRWPNAVAILSDEQAWDLAARLTSFELDRLELDRLDSALAALADAAEPGYWSPTPGANPSAPPEPQPRRRLVNGIPTNPATARPNPIE
jgi:hypothetical protein